MHIATPCVATAVSPLLFRKLGYEIPFHSLAFLLVLLSCSLPCCLEILDLNGPLQRGECRQCWWPPSVSPVRVNMITWQPRSSKFTWPSRNCTKSARVILVLKAVLYVGSKSWMITALILKDYFKRCLDVHLLQHFSFPQLHAKVFTSHLWSAWPWRCNDIFDLV